MKHKKNGLVPDDVFMSRRDQIAAQALTGILSGVVYSDEAWTAETVCFAAVECADELIDQLKKEPGIAPG